MAFKNNFVWGPCQNQKWFLVKTRLILIVFLIRNKMDASAYQETKTSQRNILLFPLFFPLKQCFKKNQLGYISHCTSAFCWKRKILSNLGPSPVSTLSWHGPLLLEADREKTAHNLQFHLRVKQGLQRQEIFWSLHYILWSTTRNSGDNQFSFTSSLGQVQGTSLCLPQQQY